MPGPTKVELVPCIYITNATFLKIGDAEVEQLATNLLRKLRLECPDKIHGVMLDCDWTAKTKARFFRLTRIVNDNLDVPLTATIRLHQYAQPTKTGVPPADRGMLMPYNVGQIARRAMVTPSSTSLLPSPTSRAPSPIPCRWTSACRPSRGAHSSTMGSSWVSCRMTKCGRR
ncbi:MAG: hypothetical protein IPK99_01410 [Flavobacteriales bacterium]|nr:hypothetical protein [Flavobacteriales bacterium]